MKDPLENGVIAVIGMHRSGTSMIAGLLHACGLFLGPEDRLLPPHETNRMGFFEHEDFVNINERILAHFGGSWHAPPPLEGRWYADPALAPLAEEARVLIASFPMNEVWGFKDPRTTILLPFWRRLIPDLRFVVCMRNPLEVGRSLLQRDDIAVQRGAWLWEHYVTAALRGTEGAPRCIVYFDEFFKIPTSAARRMVEFCGLAWPEDAKWVEKTIRSDLHHHQVGLQEFFEEDDLPARAKIIYLMTRAVSRDGYAAVGAGDDDMKALRLSALVDFVRQMGEENALLRTERRLGETMTALAENERALAGSVTKVSSLQEIISQKDSFTDDIKKLNGKFLEDKERQVIAANDALSRKQIELEELTLRHNRVLNENEQQLARIKKEYENIFADRDRQLSELREILKEKETRFNAFERESRDLILKKDAEIRDKTTALNDSYKNIEKSKVEIDNLLKQMGNKEQAIKDLVEESKNHFLRFSELENSVLEKEKEIKEAEQTIFLKIQLLVKQNKAIFALSERTRNQETVLRIKDQYCRNIEKEIRSKIEIIKNLENAIQEKETQHLHDNERLVSAGREIAESNVKERSFETQIENLNRSIRLMEADIDEKSRKITELETLLTEHAETLRNIFESQSWKAIRFYGKIKGFFLS